MNVKYIGLSLYVNTYYIILYVTNTLYKNFYEYHSTNRKLHRPKRKMRQTFYKNKKSFS
jgi:hypothetical protein